MPTRSRPVPSAEIGRGALLGDGMSDTDSEGIGRSQGPVSGVSKVGHIEAVSPAHEAIPPKTPRKLTDGNRAIAAVIEVASRTGQGVRVGCIGDTGTGKTELLKRTIDAYARATGAGLVIVDDGAQAGYEGEERVSLAEVARSPIEGERLVLVGDVFGQVRAEPEEGARLAWAMVQRRKKVGLVIDELNDAVKNSTWKKGVELVPRALTKGRKYSLSVFWTTQQVQDCPREAFNETDYIFCFRLVGTGLDRLEERGYLRGIDRTVIEGLPGFDAPPDLLGQFVLLRRGAAWDGRIYRLTL